MFIVAVLLVVLVEVVLHGVAITTQGSLSRGGKTEWPMRNLRTATETHPPSPVPPLATDTSCPAPPGTIGPAGLLRYTNTGHGAECETQHNIQEAAVREVPDYRSSVAPAIILTVAAHKVATRSQRRRRLAGPMALSDRLPSSRCAMRACLRRYGSPRSSARTCTSWGRSA
jgi:hypothetical protein